MPLTYYSKTACPGPTIRKRHALDLLFENSMPWTYYSKTACPGPTIRKQHALNLLSENSMPWTYYSKTACPGLMGLLQYIMAQILLRD